MSRKVKILVVGYRKLNELIYAVSEEFHDLASIEVVEALPTDSTQPGHIEQIISSYSPDVIASAGANAAYLKASLDTPVVTQGVSVSDLLRVLAKAKNLGRNIHLYSYSTNEKQYEDILQIMSKAMDLQLSHYEYQTTDGAREAFMLAVAENRPDVVVGSSVICNLADERKLPSLLIYSKESAKELLRNAINVGNFNDTSKLGLHRHAAASSIVSVSRIMQQAVSRARASGAVSSPVLLTGESGTGKELFAQEIHKSSSYSRGPLVAVNCGSIPQDLFESELFGYSEGAFTSSRRGGYAGLIKLADTGTLFLDEVGELPMSQQVKLLRVLEEGVIRPLGSGRELKVNFRLIAATNVNLEKMVASGGFRRDLFYRLNVLRVALPPLRARGGDILNLTETFLREYSTVHRHDVNTKILVDLLAKPFLDYGWPGNVRELRNFSERVVVECITQRSQFLDLEGLYAVIPELRVEAFDDMQEGPLKRHETIAIKEAMEKFGNDKKAVCAYLGISSTTLWRKLKA